MSQTHLELADLLKAVNKKIFRLVKDVLDEFELPPASRTIVFSIREEQGVTISEVARRAGLAKSHVSNTIGELVARGLVEKRSDPSDQRLVRLYTTEKASRLFDEIHDTVRARLSRALAPIPREKLDTVLEVLELLDAAIEEGAAPAGFAHTSGRPERGGTAEPRA